MFNLQRFLFCFRWVSVRTISAKRNWGAVCSEYGKETIFTLVKLWMCKRLDFCFQYLLDIRLSSIDTKFTFLEYSVQGKCFEKIRLSRRTSIRVDHGLCSYFPIILSRLSQFPRLNYNFIKFCKTIAENISPYNNFSSTGAQSFSLYYWLT